MHYGYCPDVIDHIDGDSLNNKIDNMRDGSKGANARNQKLSDSNTSGVTGVSWDGKRNKWCSGIGVREGKRKNLGRYSNFNDAVIARKMAEIEFDYHVNHGSIR